MGNVAMLIIARNFWPTTALVLPSNVTSSSVRHFVLLFSPINLCVHTSWTKKNLLFLLHPFVYTLYNPPQPSSSFRIQPSLSFQVLEFVFNWPRGKKSQKTRKKGEYRFWLLYISRQNRVFIIKWGILQLWICTNCNGFIFNPWWRWITRWGRGREAKPWRKRGFKWWTWVACPWSFFPNLRLI